MTPERERIVKRLVVPVVYLALQAAVSWWRTGTSWYSLVFTVLFAVVAAEVILGAPSRPVRRVVVEASIRLGGLIVAFVAAPLWLRVAGLLTFLIPAAINVASWRKAPGATASSV